MYPFYYAVIFTNTKTIDQHYYLFCSNIKRTMMFSGELNTCLMLYNTPCIMRCQVRQKAYFFKKIVKIWPPLLCASLFISFYFSFPHFCVERINNSTGTVRAYHEMHNFDGSRICKGFIKHYLSWKYIPYCCVIKIRCSEVVFVTILPKTCYFT